MSRCSPSWPTPRPTTQDTRKHHNLYFSPKTFRNGTIGGKGECVGPGRPPLTGNRFVSFVRAGEAKLRGCVRRTICNAGEPNGQNSGSSASASASPIEPCVFTGALRICVQYACVLPGALLLLGMFCLCFARGFKDLCSICMCFARGFKDLC